MTVNIWILGVALLLLWLPRQWLRFGGKVVSLPRHHRPARNLRDNSDVSLKFKEEFTKPRNLVDLLRAAAGSVAISAGCFGIGPDASKQTGTSIFLLQIAVLLVAVLLQIFRFEGRFNLVAPVFYLLGLSFGLIGWQAALLACVAIWAFNLVLPSASVFLFIFAALELVFGVVLSIATGVPRRDVLLACALTLLPFLLSAVTRRRLVQLNKKRRSTIDANIQVTGPEHETHPAASDASRAPRSSKR